jgi:hypothetical protein
MNMRPANFPTPSGYTVVNKVGDIFTRLCAFLDEDLALETLRSFMGVTLRFPLKEETESFIADKTRELADAKRILQS